MVGLIIYTENSMKYIESFIGNLIANSDYPYKIFIIDNCSEDGTGTWLYKEGFEIVLQNKPTKLSVILNLGLSRFLQDSSILYIGFLKPEMYFYPAWLSNLLKLFQYKPSIGKISAHNFKECYSKDFAQHFMETYKFEFQPGFNEPWLIPKELVKKIGFFDEGYISFAPFAEWEYNNRLVEAGFKVVIAKGSVVYNYNTNRLMVYECSLSMAQSLENEAKEDYLRYLKRWGAQHW